MPVRVAFRFRQRVLFHGNRQLAYFPVTFSVVFRLDFMRKPCFRPSLLFCSGLLLAAGSAQTAPPSSKVRLDAPAALEVVNGETEITTYRGRKAVHLLPQPGHETGDGAMLAILKGTDFRDGAIDVDVAGAPRPGAEPGMKGFIGIAFRVQPQGSALELIYLRPSNGRAPDQLTRNHSVQYVSDPDFGWERLRKETPGMYESYVDLEPGAWTKIRVEVSGKTARLYVNGARQPCLIVNDLKRGESHGPIALWAHETTAAYFSNLTIH
jgi:hypothetical protein